ncbi:hypothetical protein ONZ45_g19064 [Pleurotus djamor]|nr:hypothetical protein ONZ45_g19064 [Pleurotus djamor]
MSYGTRIYITSSYEKYIPVPKHLRFAPPNGKLYTEEITLWTPRTAKHCCSEVEHHLPPLFYCCWAVGKQALLDMALKEFPDYVRRTKHVGGKVLSSTVFTMDEGIVERFNVPSDLRDRICVTGVLLPDNTVDLALCIGDNVDGIVRPHGIIDEMAKTLFNGEMPQWHLSPLCWQWHRKSRFLTPEETEVWMKEQDAKTNLSPVAQS